MTAHRLANRRGRVATRHHAAMRRLATVALLLVACHATLHCQSLRLGGQIGVCLASASVAGMADGYVLDAQSGRIAAVVAELQLSSMISVTASPRIVDKGASICWRDAVLETAAYSYIDLPIAARVTFNIGALSPFLTAGATVGRLVSARYYTEHQHGSSTAYVKNQIVSFDASLDLGAGLSYDAGSGSSVYACLGYEHGLVNVLRSAPGIAMSSWHSRGLTITAGLLLPL